MDIVSRVKNIIATPKTEWQVIAAEPADIAGLYTTYIAPLAAIGAIVALVLTAIVLSFAAAIASALLSYVFGLVALFVIALVLSKLAPNFGGRDDVVQALKLLAYSFTPTWIASIVLIVPFVGLLVMLVALIYGIYLFYLGSTPVLGIPADKAVIFTLVGVVIAIVIDFVFTWIAGRLAAIA